MRARNGRRKPPRRAALRGAMLAGACLAVFPPRSAGADEPGWPLWPSEVDQIAAPIFAPDDFDETVRWTALIRLSGYPTSLIQPAVLAGLEDEASQIRRQALSMCADREMRVCVSRAARLWNEEADLALRTRALDVVALDPATPAHLDILLEGLDADDEIMRSHAAGVISRAPLGADGLARARAALVARLADASTRVRADAARALGILGTGRGGVVLIRLLADPDPIVRESATEALGSLGDPRSAPALRRNLEQPMSARLATLTVNALAQLPGEEIDELLLELLDSQPTGLSRTAVAEAIAMRHSPSDALVDGLVSRLRDPSLRRELLDALLELGDRARPALEGALARGLEPELAADVQLLVNAAAPAAEPAEIPVGAATRPATDLPAPDDREGWMRVLDLRDDAARARAVIALRDLGPEWAFSLALARISGSGGDPSHVRGWMELLAIAPEDAVELHDAPFAAAALERWAHDPGLRPDDRCRAALALAHPPRRRRHGWVHVDGLLSSSSPDVRACAALGIAHRADPRRVEAALHDPNPRVRAAAALGLAGRDLPRRLASMLDLLAQSDPDPDVRRAIRWSRAAEAAPLTLAVATHAPSGRARWLRLEPGTGSAAILAPAFGARRFALLPAERVNPVAEPEPPRTEGPQPIIF